MGPVDEEDHFRIDGRFGQGESFAVFDEIRTGRPGEVVDVLLDIGQRPVPSGSFRSAVRRPVAPTMKRSGP